MKKEPRLYDLPPGKLYGGRCDLIAEVDGILGVWDWKTGTKPKDPNGYPEWALQTAAYRCGAGIPGLKANSVIHLDKTTGFPTTYDYSNTYELDITAFNALVLFWRNRYRDKIDDNGKGPSVTTVTGLLDKSGQLMWWATDCMDLYLMKRAREIGHPLGLAELAALVGEAKRNYRKVSQEAMDIGTMVHACVEQFLRTRVEPKIEDERVLAGFVAFLEWFDQHHVKVIETEKVIYG